MNIVSQAHHPFAIVITADPEKTILSTSWRSTRGLHVVTMQLSTTQALDDDEPELLENALRDFLLLVESEVNELMEAAAEEER